MRIVKVKDLKDYIGIVGTRPLLWCSICGAESSANHGDYFAADPDYVFICCDVPMRLVEKRITFVDVV